MKNLLLAAAALCLAAPAFAGGLDPGDMLEKIAPLLDDQPPPPPVSEAEVIEIEKDDMRTYVFVKGAIAHPPAPVNLGGDGRLLLVRQETGERVEARYRRADGSYDEAELAKITHIMRCRLTRKETPVSTLLVEILDAVEDRFGKKGLLLLSGYRTPVLNRQVSGSARYSLHMLGWAADIRLPGRPTVKAAEFARKLKAGGVGYYPAADFLHLDSGRPRAWEGPGAEPDKKRK